MDKRIYGIVISILALSLAGCVSIKKVIRDRVDQDISGNRGVLQGEVPVSSITGTRTREYVDVRVEIPTMEEIKKETAKRPVLAARTQDKQPTGNRGYFGGTGYPKELPPVQKTAPCPVVSTHPDYIEYEDDMIEEETVKEIPAVLKTYKVKKGDSLSKIAKETYGKASKWTVIYEANSEKIKDPNRLKVGTVLVIPELKENVEGGSSIIK